MKAFSQWRQTLATLHVGEARHGNVQNYVNIGPGRSYCLGQAYRVGVFGWFLRGVFLRRNTRLIVVYLHVARSAHIRQHFVGGTGAVRQSRVGITSHVDLVTARNAQQHGAQAFGAESNAVCLFISVGSGLSESNQLSLTRYPALKLSLRLLLLLRRLASWMARQRSCGLAQSSSGVALVTRKPPICQRNIRSVTTNMTTNVSFAQHREVNGSNFGVKQPLQYDCRTATHPCRGSTNFLVAQVRAPAADTQPLVGVATKRWNLPHNPMLGTHGGCVASRSILRVLPDAKE